MLKRLVILFFAASTAAASPAFAQHFAQAQSVAAQSYVSYADIPVTAAAQVLAAHLGRVTAVCHNTGSTNTARVGGSIVSANRGTVLYANAAGVTFDLTDALYAGGDLYDVGLYNPAGTLQAHTGPITLNSTVCRSLPIAGGRSVTIQPSRYYMAFGCGAAATAQIEGNGGSSASFAINAAGPATRGGALPATMTPPADSWGEDSWYLGIH